MFSYRTSSQYQLSQELTTINASSKASSGQRSASSGVVSSSGSSSGASSGASSTTTQIDPYHHFSNISSTALHLLDAHNSTHSSLQFSPMDHHLLLIYHLRMIRNLGSQLKAPHVVVVSAMMYMRRFYAKNTIHICDPLILVPTCILLSSKIEEYPLTAEKIYASWTEKTPNTYKVRDILELEKYLMCELNFQMVSYHAFRPLAEFLRDMVLHDLIEADASLREQFLKEQQLEEEALSRKNLKGSSRRRKGSSLQKSSTSSTSLTDASNHEGDSSTQNNSSAGTSQTAKSNSSSSQSTTDEYSKLYQYAWNLLNDAYFSDIIILYPPSMIAMSALYMTSILFKHEFKDNFEERIKNWFENLCVDMKPIGAITEKMVALYDTLKTFDSDIPKPLLKLHRWVSEGSRYSERSPAANTGISPSNHISPGTFARRR